MPVDSLPLSGSAVADDNSAAVRKKQRHKYTAFDSALIRAARDSLTVGVYLALDTNFTDEDGYFIGGVKIVDTYSVLFTPKGREIWISKPHIVAVEILS